MLRPLLMATLVMTLAACGSPAAGSLTLRPIPKEPELAACPSTIVIDNFKYLPDDCQVSRRHHDHVSQSRHRSAHGDLSSRHTRSVRYQGHQPEKVGDRDLY